MRSAARAFIVRARVPMVVAYQRENDFGWNIGGGIKIPLSTSFETFIERVTTASKSAAPTVEPRASFRLPWEYCSRLYSRKKGQSDWTGLFYFVDAFY
jgi:hypothetical protein